MFRIVISDVEEPDLCKSRYDYVHYTDKACRLVNKLSVTDGAEIQSQHISESENNMFGLILLELKLCFCFDDLPPL